MGKKLIALDWNGTLFDDLEPHVRAANDFLAFFGAPPIDVHTYQEDFEVPIINFVKKRGLDVDLFIREGARLAKEFHKAVDAYSENSVLREGVSEFLIWAEAHDMKPIILSNHLDGLIKKELARHGLSSHFNDTAIIANQESSTINHQRGKGEKLAEYMACKGIASKDVIVIGDTAEEADIARQIGASSGLLTGGYNSERRLRAAQPTILSNGFSDLRIELCALWKLDF